jgi:hypothetical protein
MDNQNKKAVYTVIDRGEGETKRSFWVRIGAAFVNRDGSFSVKLDALPVNGSLQIREWPVREDWRTRESTAPEAAAAAPRTHADIFAGAD